MEKREILIAERINATVSRDTYIRLINSGKFKENFNVWVDTLINEALDKEGSVSKIKEAELVPSFTSEGEENGNVAC